MCQFFNIDNFTFQIQSSIHLLTDHVCAYISMMCMCVCHMTCSVCVYIMYVLYILMSAYYVHLCVCIHVCIIVYLALHTIPTPILEL